jgi:hypothetical protein
VEALIDCANQPEFANTEVFNILSSGLTEQTLQPFLSPIDETKTESRELFALFSAGIRERHPSEPRDRTAHAILEPVSLLTAKARTMICCQIHR